MNRDEKMVEILENEQFQMEVEKTETPEDVRALLAKHGLEMSQEELDEFCAQVTVAMQPDELSETELEDVAGGKKKSPKKAVKKAIKTIVRVNLAIRTGGISEYLICKYQNGYYTVKYN